MHALLEPLWDAPNFPDLLEEANRAWADEQVRRAEFVTNLRADQKAEFINGEVVAHSPVALVHLLASANLTFCLTAFVGDVGHIFTEKCLVRAGRHDFEPDILYFGPEKARQLRPHQIIFPVPDFVVEVLSESTEKFDRGVKLRSYGACGAGEYWIVDPLARTVEQFLPDARGELVLAAKVGLGGVVSAVVLAGLELPVACVFETAASRRFAAGLLARSGGAPA